MLEVASTMGRCGDAEMMRSVPPARAGEEDAFAVWCQIFVRTPARCADQRGAFVTLVVATD